MAKILVVDDVLVNRKLLSTIVKNLDSNIDIYEASNGREALQFMENIEFGVVILDVMMPQINGIEVLEIIKNERRLLNTSVIICSAVNDIESVQKALDLGALDYFTKPLNTEQMRVTLPLKIKNAISFYEQKKKLIQYNEMFRNQMQLAEEIQRATIIDFLESASVKMDSRYIPCNEIGGDMFAMKQVNNKNWFIISDITGHGVAAAMMSTMIKVVFNYSVVLSSNPSEVLSILNNTLFEIFQKVDPPLITAFIGFLEDDTLHYANAGHPYPIFFENKQKRIKYLEQPSFALGFLENSIFEDLSLKTEKYDFLILYTDGLYDIGKLDGNEHKMDIKAFMEDYFDSNKINGKHLLDEMIDYFEEFNEDGFDDDVALVYIEKIC